MKNGKYKHYKGQNYEVFGVALHSETREKLVLYKCLYKTPKLTEEFGEEPFFVRPYNMFNEEIEFEGKKVKRFKFIG
ncbi:MAG: DUF1653 domain-containing protein [Candidatus Gracilibacteria bacterium]|nr:DUF1653 domain-containing protein [Candidatus Gracilibacteria bacterium]